MTERSVLLDTSFFLRLFDTSSPLHENAKSYYKYFLEHDYGELDFEQGYQ